MAPRIVYCNIINLLWSLMSKMSTTFRSVSYGPCSRTDGSVNYITINRQVVAAAVIVFCLSQKVWGRTAPWLLVSFSFSSSLIVLILLSSSTASSSWLFHISRPLSLNVQFIHEYNHHISFLLCDLGSTLKAFTRYQYHSHPFCVLFGLMQICICFLRNLKRNY